ncbi:hypothetical protein [Nocardioides sp.]|uniref:hypothetical protein n=1 Tax=Nocardioides sp. TaxID=35761 RepID=UPI002C3C3EF8|nr:hypothetical protein [Nocardioides sp.]HXH78433.1 hypothetical protein [Nocardioides sp.]
MSQTREAVDERPARARDWRTEAAAAARVWAAVLLVGVACGVVVVGVLSRLVMSLLASTNPGAAGVRSDDGFIMGQVTLAGSAQLVGSGAQLGAVAAFLYVALQGLMIGPAWFRLVSISVGPGVVVGSILVHTTGVDFTILGPLWLTVGSFVLLPVLFCAALHLLAERALARGGVRAKPQLVLGLLLAVAVFPLTVVLGLGWWMCQWVPTDQVGLRRLGAWAIRVVLAVVFVLAVLDLVSDVTTLAE